MRMIEHAGAPTTVAYQGGPGANGERAIFAHWKDAAHPVPMASFPAVAAAVAEGRVTFGVIPVWNSALGAVRPGCSALDGAVDRLEQVGEVTVPVQHAVLALPGVCMDDLCAIGSHPAALAQCRRLFSAHPGVTAVPPWESRRGSRRAVVFGGG